MSITIDDVIDLLPIIADRQFAVEEDGAIRDERNRCPLCALANEIDPVVDYCGFASAALRQADVDMPMDERRRFMRAADVALDDELRARMKQALGVS
jgi:hypothetical protein